ncbi:hypothetical protein DSUL_50435 [Desulfovibrionales bacterium]
MEVAYIKLCDLNKSMGRDIGSVQITVNNYGEPQHAFAP